MSLGYLSPWVFDIQVCKLVIHRPHFSAMSSNSTGSVSLVQGIALSYIRNTLVWAIHDSSNTKRPSKMWIWNNTTSCLSRKILSTGTPFWPRSSCERRRCHRPREGLAWCYPSKVFSLSLTPPLCPHHHDPVPSTVTNVGEFVISGTLKNSGSQSISVIKDPEGPLFDNFPADIFDFQSTKNGEPGFVGAIAKWSLETYLTHPGEEDKTVPKVEERSPAQDNQRRDESISGRGSTSSSVKSDSDTESLTFSKSQVPPETIHDLTPNDEMKFDYKGLCLLSFSSLFNLSRHDSRGRIRLLAFRRWRIQR